MRNRWTPLSIAVAAISCVIVATGSAQAKQPAFEIYGFAQADFVQDFKHVNSNWDDTLRPSRIPTTDGVAAIGQIMPSACR